MRMVWLRTGILIVGNLLLATSATAPVLAQESHDPPLLLPFPAGPGTIISGYENGNFHSYANLYSLDVCPDTGCVIEESEVVAPTDLTYDLPVDANNVEGDRADYHIFQIDETSTEHVCLALGHFDLTAPGTLIDGKRTFQRGDPLGKLLDYQYTDGTSHPHYHINLFTVDKAYRCGVSDDDHSKRRALAFTGAYELDGIAYEPDGPHGHEGEAAVSHNGSAGSPTTPTASVPPEVAPPVQWIEPVGRRQGPPEPHARRLADTGPRGWQAHRPDRRGPRRLPRPPGPVASAPACSATAADAENLWSCTADLAAMGVPAGPLELTFDVLRTDGSTLAAPDGAQAVTYDRAADGPA